MYAKEDRRAMIVHNCEGRHDRKATFPCHLSIKTDDVGCTTGVVFDVPSITQDARIGAIIGNGEESVGRKCRHVASGEVFEAGSHRTCVIGVAVSVIEGILVVQGSGKERQDFKAVRIHGC